jgi:hypothetical protein
VTLNCGVGGDRHSLVPRGVVVLLRDSGERERGRGAEIVTLGGPFISSIHSFGHSFTDAHIAFKLKCTELAIYMLFSCCPC